MRNQTVAMAPNKRGGPTRSTPITRASSTPKTVNFKLQIPENYPPLESTCDVILAFHFTHTEVEPLVDAHDPIGQTYRSLSRIAAEAIMAMSMKRGMERLSLVK